MVAGDEESLSRPETPRRRDAVTHAALSEITKIWIVIQLKRNGIRHVSRSKSLSSCFINGGQILIG